LYGLIKSDFENNIFVQYGDMPEFQRVFITAVNIKTGQYTEIEFKGKCGEEKNYRCVDSVVYADGKLTIAATVKKKWRKKYTQEIHTIQI
jgi:hypothetical protein